MVEIKETPAVGQEMRPAVAEFVSLDSGDGHGHAPCGRNTAQGVSRTRIENYDAINGSVTLPGLAVKG